MRLLLDQNLPASLASVFLEFDCEALHVKMLGLAEADDRTVWREALRLAAVVVSKDSDFLVLAAVEGRLVRLRVGNRSNQDLADILRAGWPEVLARLRGGERVVELRA